MIRITTAKTLDALRREAGQLPQLREQAAQADELRHQAAAARTAAERADAQLRALCDDTVAGLASLKIATEHPGNGTRVQGGIALHLVRRWIGEIKAEGSPGEIEGIRILDVLPGTDSGRAGAHGSSSAAGSPGRG